MAPAELPKALGDLAGRPSLDEVAVVSTCMRTEVYAVVNRFHGAMADIREFLAGWSGQAPEAFADRLYWYFDDAAVTHLFRLAAGLDSASVGEPEVLGQVRSAWEVARQEGACGPALGSAFNHAVQVGRRARSETAISRGSTSVSYAASELAAQALGSLEGKCCLVAGLGEVGETAARALAEVPGLGELVLFNRSGDKAKELAGSLGAQAGEWAGLGAALAGADVVVCATSGEAALLHEDTVRTAMASRPGRPMALVDLAVPRDVEPAVASVPGVSLFNMDDIGRYVAARVGDRHAEVPAVERIVAEEVDRYNAALAARSVAPLVAQLYENAEQVRQAEVRRFGNGPLDEAAVEALSRRLVAKLLHEPAVNLKAAAGTSRGETLAEAFRDLFGLTP